LLADPHRILGLIKDDLVDLKERYGDSRRTRIAAEVSEEFTEEDLIPQEEVLIAITRRSYVKRLPIRAYRQGRGRRVITTRDEDAVLYLFSANTLDDVLFFTNRGRVFRQKAHQIPDTRSRGIPLVNLLPLQEGERVTAALAVENNGLGKSGLQDSNGYLVMVTRQGRIKRLALQEVSAVRSSGLAVIILDEGDELGWVKLTRGDQEVIIVTEQGQALRFREDQVRPQGRAARGVMGIRLAEGDAVTSMDVVEPGGDLFVITARGYGKRTPLDEYSPKGRYTGGVATFNTKSIKRTGPIAAARVVQPQDEVTLISAEGMVLHTPVEKIPVRGRATRGERLMTLADGDVVASVARISQDDKESSQGEL